MMLSDPALASWRNSHSTDLNPIGATVSCTHHQPLSGAELGSPGPENTVGRGCGSWEPPSPGSSQPAGVAVPGTEVRYSSMTVTGPHPLSEGTLRTPAIPLELSWLWRSECTPSSCAGRPLVLGVTALLPTSEPSVAAVKGLALRQPRHITPQSTALSFSHFLCDRCVTCSSFPLLPTILQ